MTWLAATWAHVKRTRAEWFAALGCLAGVIAIATWQGYGLGSAFALIGLFIGGFLSIVIHELGHALCGWAAGWRIWIISAAPVSWRLGHGPRFSTRLSGDVGGFVLGSPQTDAHDNRWRSILFSAGGPLASLIAGPAFIYWLTTFPPGSWDTPHTAGLLGAALALGFHSAYAAAFTIWPWKSANGAPNDMLMILAALFAPQSNARERALIWAEALFEYGIEPSAWPDWVRDAVDANALTPKVAALSFAMAIDAGEISRAHAIAAARDDDAAKVLRAYLLAANGDGDAADDALAAIEDRGKIEHLAPWRSLALAYIQAHAGAHASAQRGLDDFAEALAENPTPHPFWQARLAQARADCG